MRGDFVVLTEDLWEDLEEFRRYSTSLDCSVVEDIELVSYWRTSKAVDLKIIDRSYQLMSPLSLDEFCNWICNERRIWNSDLLHKISGIEVKDTSTSLNRGIYLCINSVQYVN